LLAKAIMSWLVRNPFKPDEDPVQYIVGLLAEEAERAGTPLTARDKEILAEESSPTNSVPEELRERTKQLVARILEAEPIDEFEREPKCFSNALQWAGDSRYPNLVALSEEIACDIGHPGPKLQGWALVKDRMLLIGCGLVVVLMMFAIVIAGHSLLGWQ